MHCFVLSFRSFWICCVIPSVFMFGYFFSWWISGAQRTSKRDWPDFKARCFSPLFSGGEPLPDSLPQLSWYLFSLHSSVSSVHYWLSFLSFSWFALWTNKSGRKYWTLMISQNTLRPLLSLSLSVSHSSIALHFCVIPSTVVMKSDNNNMVLWYIYIN